MNLVEKSVLCATGFASAFDMQGKRTGGARWHTRFKRSHQQETLHPVPVDSIWWSAAVVILSAVFFLLLTSWVLWGWLVGESRDIRWMRRVFAAIFVFAAALICFVTGAIITHQYDEARYRRLVIEFSQLLEERLETNRIQDVRDALSHVNDEPDESSSFSRDRLERLKEVTEALRKSSGSAIAVNTSDERRIQ